MRHRIFILAALAALAAHAVQMASQPWVTNRIAEAVAAIPAPDFTTNNAALVETIRAKAPAPDLTPATNYTDEVVSSATNNLRSKADLVYRNAIHNGIEKWIVQIQGVADPQIAEWSEEFQKWDHNEPPVNGFNIAIAEGGYIFESTGGQYGLEYDKILSNGAFCVDEYGWEHKKYINLVRNSDYKGGSSVVPKGVNIKIADSPENVCEAVLRGEVDCYRMETRELEQAKQNKMNLTAFGDTVWGIVFNMDNEVFQNKDIRVSMLEALDRKKIVSSLPERCKPAEDIVPDTAKIGEIAYREFVGKGMGIKFSENAKSDFEKAVDSLNEHDEEYYWYYDYEEVEFPELNILCTDEREMQGVVNGIINAWNGITGRYANKTPVSREELDEKVFSGDFDIAIVPLKPEGESPVDMLAFFESKNEYNVSGLADEKYDKVIGDILARSDNSVMDKMVQAEKYISENGIFYPLYTEDRYYVSARNVTGIIFHPYGAEADFSSAEKIGG